MSTELNMVNASLRELMAHIDLLRNGKVSVERVMKLIDEAENHVDTLIQALAPERITDERFNAAVGALKEVTSRFKKLREYILAGKYVYAKKFVLDIQESIRSLYRLLILIRAGTPTHVIFQVTPQFLREISVPETLLYTNPMAAQIYNTLARRGGATVEELAVELKIDDKTRDEFNRAIAQLISMGYVKPYFTPDNKMVLRPAR